MPMLTCVAGNNSSEGGLTSAVAWGAGRRPPRRC